MEQFKFFWQNSLSQWHMCSFAGSGYIFNCAEQFMMFGKAVLFGDMETAEKIMSVEHPREQKKLGRQVKNFDPEVWSKWAKKIVYAGNMYRFAQNDYLYNDLMATNGRTLVEASPYDKIWGIGLKKDDPRCLDRKTWQGENWLGEVLTRVRNDLKFGDVDNGILDDVSELFGQYNNWQV